MPRGGTSAMSMDYVKAPLNPCSLESIPEPVMFGGGFSSSSSSTSTDENEEHNDIQQAQQAVWPVMLSCYQLQPDGITRVGKLQMYTIQVPSDLLSPLNTSSDSTSSDSCRNSSIKKSMVLKFGDPYTILQDNDTTDADDDAAGASSGAATTTSCGGILDGKWTTIRAGCEWWYATAHSTGEIVVHSITKRNETEAGGGNEGNIDDGCNNDNNYQNCGPFRVKFMGKSEVETSSTSSSSPPPLCLALHWDGNNNDSSSRRRRLVSSYSNGRVALHTVTYLEHTQCVQILEVESWLAHTMFTCPSEVWSVCFANTTMPGGGNDDHNNALIMSGGDDAVIKFWDSRCINRPIQVVKDLFQAGVTALSPCPTSTLVAVGSYDETICLFDVRNMTSSSKTVQLTQPSAPLGGGIWRIKWNPIDHNRLLVGAMHGGCRIVQLDGLNNNNDNNNNNDTAITMSAVKEFTEHTSMAYGADWLTCQHPTKPGYFEAAISCSFYDQAVYLWDTVA